LKSSDYDVFSPGREKEGKDKMSFPSKVARTGIEPATQGFSVLENQFQTVPWITLNQPNLPKNTGKDRLFPEKLGDRRQFKLRPGKDQLRQNYGILYGTDRELKACFDGRPDNRI
jgi:hypothetical protein